MSYMSRPGEDDVVKKIETQVRTGMHLYDAYVNDSDLIGWHSRRANAVNLTDYMTGEGKSVTLPTLDINDFIGKSFTTGPDGKLYQLPDQQFANLYWYRKTGSTGLTCRRNSRKYTAINWMSRLTGQPTKILPSFYRSRKRTGW